MLPSVVRVDPSVNVVQLTPVVEERVRVRVVVRPLSTRNDGIVSGK